HREPDVDGGQHDQAADRRYHADGDPDRGRTRLGRLARVTGHAADQVAGVEPGPRSGREQVPDQVVAQPRGGAGDAGGPGVHADQFRADPDGEQAGGDGEPAAAAARTNAVTCDDRVDGTAEHGGEGKCDGGTGQPGQADQR